MLRHLIQLTFMTVFTILATSINTSSQTGRLHHHLKIHHSTNHNSNQQQPPDQQPPDSGGSNAQPLKLKLKLIPTETNLVKQPIHNAAAQHSPSDHKRKHYSANLSSSSGYFKPKIISSHTSNFISYRHPSAGAKQRRAIWPPPQHYASRQVSPSPDPATDYLNFNNPFANEKQHPGMRLLLKRNATNNPGASPPSCTSDCHPPRHSRGGVDESSSGAGHFPTCGAWLHYDNAIAASGTYLLNASMVNLTCVVHSLPKPVPVEWVFQPTDTDRPRSVEPVCTTMRTVTDCRVNSVGEHRVRSTCLKAISRLEDSGMYYCRVAYHGSEELTSPATRVEVYGIESLDPVPLRTIEYNQTNTLELRICAHPAPQVLWINTATGLSVYAGGANSGPYTALALYRIVTQQGSEQNTAAGGHVLPNSALEGSQLQEDKGNTKTQSGPNPKYAPAQIHQYCYVSKLVIAKAQHQRDESFVAMVTNNVASQQVHYKLKVAGQPLKSKCGLLKAPAVVFIVVLSIGSCMF